MYYVLRLVNDLHRFLLDTKNVHTKAGTILSSAHFAHSIAPMCARRSISLASLRMPSASSRPNCLLSPSRQVAFPFSCSAIASASNCSAPSSVVSAVPPPRRLHRPAATVRLTRAVRLSPIDTASPHAALFYDVFIPNIAGAKMLRRLFLCAAQSRQRGVCLCVCKQNIT